MIGPRMPQAVFNAPSTPPALRHPAAIARVAPAPKRRGWLPLLGGITLISTLFAANAGLAAEPPSTPQPSRDAPIGDWLAAGELPSALSIADQVGDPAEKSRLLAAIHADQLRRGDTEGAAATARKMPQREERGRLGAAGSRERSRQGGASVADFTDLIDLITSTVAPDSWDTVGGAGSVKPYVSGVFVDATGELKVNQRAAGRDLTKLASAARVADLAGDMSQSVPMRVVALRRLDAAITSLHDRGELIPETMRRLAGLRRIQRIFLDEATGDLLLAGPAGEWAVLPDGRAQAPQTGEPVLSLDDLTVLIRALWSPPNRQQAAGQFGCSINTRDANLKDLRDFVVESTAQGPLRPGQLRGWVRQLQERLGLQDVEIFGVPANSHVARVLVEADYRMKLIGVGQLEGGPGIPSYFELLEQYKATRGLPLEALRWWLTMRYDAILHTSDRRAFELVGGGVLVQSENQFVSTQGKHVPSGVAEPINRAFAENFTRHYSDLARRDPIFAELRNVFDLALAVTLAREEGWLGEQSAPLSALGPNGTLRPAVDVAPRVVESVVAHRVYNQTDIVVQVAGGVQIDLPDTLRSRARPTAKPVPQVRPEDDRWWWNVRDPDRAP
ncbi:MAG: DUF1598 domain-containing protein [Planctomycetaceae bacterium]